MEDVAAERKQQNDKRKEREDGVGGNAEGVGVDLGARHVACERGDLSPEAILREDGLDVLDRRWRQLGLVGLRLFGLIGDDKRHRTNRNGEQDRRHLHRC